jgi:hypothetical protein
LREEIKLEEDKFQNNQERRSGMERRKYEYALHIPERRKGKDRRKGDPIQKLETSNKNGTSTRGNRKKTENSKE